MNSSDEKWMKEALILARRAEAEGEVPVGAVIVHQDEIVGSGWNRNLGLNDPSAHAEIQAMREAGQARDNHRLDFGMCTRIIETQVSIPAGADNFILVNYHSAHRHFAFRFRAPGEDQRFFHPLLVR